MTDKTTPAGIDLDKLEALARAATPGPWQWWTSNSTLRLTGADGRDGGVLYGSASSGVGDVVCSMPDRAFIEAANPSAILALIDLANRAAPRVSEQADEVDAKVRSLTADIDRQLDDLAAEFGLTTEPHKQADERVVRLHALARSIDASGIASRSDAAFLESLAIALAQQAAPEAPAWGPVETVADMVRNLLTLDQSTPIHAAFHVDIEGKRRCRTRPVSISRERVIDGKWVDPSRKDVPYAVIVWAKQDEAAPAPATQQAGAAVVSEAFLKGAHAEFNKAMPPGSLTSFGHRYVVNALRAAIKFYIGVAAHSIDTPLRLLREILKQHDEHAELIRAEGDYPVPNPTAERIRALLDGSDLLAALDTPLMRAHLDRIRHCAPQEVEAATAELFEFMSSIAYINSRAPAPSREAAPLDDQQIIATARRHAPDGDNPVFVLPYSHICGFARELLTQQGAGQAAQAGADAGRIATYVPGQWFDARSLDEMQAFYLYRLPAIREAAKEHGYAIGVHGSIRRDFDLMAMQWRADASPKDALAHAIAIAACGITREGTYPWESKPNGRFAVSLPICWTDHSNPEFGDKPSLGHIDLSVIDPSWMILFIEKRAEDYLRDNADTDEDTGAPIWRYGDAGRDYHSTLVELADDLRAAMSAATASQKGD
jgi:hypothetical protein